jgi:hypothetical protein
MAWHTVPRSHCTAPVPCLPTATTSPWRPDGVAHGATQSLHGAGKCLPMATTSPWRPDGVAHGATQSLHGAGKCLPMATTSPWRPDGVAHGATQSLHGAGKCLPMATTSPWRPDGVAHGATRSLHGAGKCLLTVPACRGSETDEMTRRRSRHAMTRGRRIAFRQSRMYQRYLRKRWHRSVAPMPCRQKYRPCAIA